MAITRAQQYRQLRRQGGIMGSNGGSMLVTPTRDGSRPGYYGPDAGHENDPGHGSNAPSGNGDGISDRERHMGLQGKTGKTDPSIGGGGVDRSKISRQQEINHQKAVAAAQAAAEEKARIEKEKKQKLQEQINKYNLKKSEKLKSFVDKNMLDIISEDELENVDVTDKGIFGNLNDIRTDLSRKTLVNSIAQKLGVMPKSYVPSVFMSDLIRSTPKGITTDSLTDMLSPDFDMGLYGISGTDLTKAKQQLDVAKQDRISQSDFDSVYGNKPPEQRGDGGNNQVYIPPPVVSSVVEPEEEIDPNSLEGILANRGIAYRFMADGGRAGFMGGGMPDDFIGGLADGNLDEMGRQMYGLGKLVKKATRAVKKIVKSPVGKAALAFGMYKFGAPLFKSEGFKNFFLKDAGKKFAFDNLSSKGILAGIGGISALSGLMSQPEEDEEETYYRGPGLDINAIRRDPYGSKGPAYGFYAEGGDVKEPVAKDTMPLLDMDGMEKDYRADGGFVPIGRMERADDVPARLSKNEFVFTADAVRNAGDGDVDKGAEVMYNMMKNLESGGKVSEESQGLDGARDMFQTSKRLEEVL